jgi:hypothetical protein
MSAVTGCRLAGPAHELALPTVRLRPLARELSPRRQTSPLVATKNRARLPTHVNADTATV